MKKFLVVTIAILLVIFFTFPGYIQGTDNNEVTGESPSTTTAGDTTTTTTAADDTTTTTTTAGGTTTTTTAADDTTTTTTSAGGTTTTTTAADDTSTTTTMTESTIPVDSTTTTDTVIADTTPPVIILTGDAVINIKAGDAFVDPGATAADETDAVVSVTVTGTVDTAKAGTYTLSYDAKDSAGNAAATVTRTVNVAEIPDITPPVITLNGNTVINLLIGSTFIDPGATAKDDKDLNVQVITTGTVNTNFAGSYVICYDASDAAGNAADTVIRTVNVFSTATVNTDKPDYIPSDYVLVTGSGWLPGETVKLDFSETLFNPVLQQTITYYTVADSEGNIRDLQYLIEIRHLGASFILNATGQTSGLTAQTTFTDLKQLTPSFSPAAGAVASGTEITISSFGSNKIYYTIDGSNPTTSASSTGPTYLYNSSAKPKITGATTIKAMATSPYPSVSPSDVATAAYTIIAPLKITVNKIVQDKSGTVINDDTQPFEVTLWKILSNLSTVQVGSAKSFSSSAPAVFDVTPDFNGQFFYVKETSPAAYTIISGSDWSVVNWANAQQISSGTDATFNVTNRQSGSRFTINKTGLKGSDRAKFTLWGPDNKIVKAGLVQDSITLDCSTSLGSIYSDTFTWNNLPDGTGYKLVESYDVDFVPNEYLYTSNLVNNEYTFDIVNGSSVSLAVINEVTGTIKAYKTDKAGLPLAGAQIGLYTTNTGNPSPIMTVYSTSVSGTPYPPNVEFLNVPSGGTEGKTYYIHEISAPDGFAVDSGYYEVKISDANLNPTLATNIINKADGSITLYKKDNGGNALEGAVFGLYTAEDETLTPITATSDINGKVEFTELSCGFTYYIREISPPSGFVPDENWYSAALTAASPHYAFTEPVINVAGGTITVTKNVVAPDGKTDVDDTKEFTITLEKSEGGNWVAVKTAKIKEGTQVIFSVPLNICYRIVETADSKYTQIDKEGEVKLTVQGQNVNICLVNKQHYALILMGKIIYQWNSLFPNIIADDDHIFLMKLEGGHPSLIEWHPIATKLPTAFLVWPGTYTVIEKPDLNYNDNGQPLILSGFDLSDFNLSDLGDIGSLAGIIVKSFGNASPEITVDGNDISPLIVANRYTPQYGTVTVTKDVVAPDVCTQVSDPEEFNVKLQRLNLTLPNILDMLDISNVGNVDNLSDLMNMLDLTQLTNLSNLVGWEDVGTSKIKEGQDAVFEGVERDHIYRVVETSVPGYMQIKGMLPFYLAPEDTEKQIDIVNRQELVFIKVVKNVIGADGSEVSDSHPFLVKLNGGSPTLLHEFAEGSPTVFAVWPGTEDAPLTYSASECSDAFYNMTDNGGAISPKPGDGQICDPIILTVTNKQVPGSISINKLGMQGSETASFSLSGPGGPYTDIILNNGSGSWTGLPWGIYTISEASPNGYSEPAFKVNGETPTLNPDGSITIEINGGKCEVLDYTVDVTNSFIPGSITINKSGLLPGQTVAFSITGPENFSQQVQLTADAGGNAASGLISGLAWGQYTVVESVPAGFNLPVFTVDSMFSPDTSTPGQVIFTLPGTDEDRTTDVVVSAANSYNYGSLTINKTGMAPGDSIDFTVTGPGGFSQVLTLTAAPGATIASGVLSGLFWGDYTITETIKPDYSATPSFVVTAGFNIVQNAGNSVTVTIPGTGANNSTIVDATLTVANLYTPPVPSTTSAATTSTEVLGLLTGGEEETTGNGAINVLGITELPFTGQNIMLLLAGFLIIAALSLIIAFSVRKKSAGKNEK